MNQEPQAALPIEPGLAEACTAQVERMKRWDAHPDSLTDEEGNAEMVRWGAVFRRAVDEPSAGLTDLAAKARLMQDDMDRFFPADRYATDNYRLMRVILRDVVALTPGEAPSAAPTDLPAPGSPEALEAFGAACRAVDRAGFRDEAEREALKIGSGLQYWTSEVVEAAQTGNFSRIMPEAVEAAKAISPARLGELLVLTLRREMRIAEAVQASRMRELYALAYPGDQEEVTDDAPASADPVDFAIEAHRSARAALTAACNPADEVFVQQAGGDTSDEAMAPARAIHEAASDAETDAWDALLETRPSDPDGLLRMLRYIAGAGPMEVLGDAREFGRNIAEAAEAALRPAIDADAELIVLGRQFDQMHAIWLAAVEAAVEPGERFDAFMEAVKARGGPTIKDIEAVWALPGVKETHDAEETAFAVLSRLGVDILRRPARTVQGLAVQARATIPQVWPGGTFEADAALAPDEDVDKEAVRAFIESCCALANSDWRGQPRAGASAFAEPAPSLSDQIIACWREWAAASGPDETDAEREAGERISARRCAFLDAAIALPSTPDNVLAKALATAWLDYVSAWERGRERDDYDPTDQLVIDIDTAIVGRFRKED